MPKTIISADSHITEPPGCYVDRIDHKYKDTAPHMVHDDKMGDIFVIEGMKKPIPMGLVAAAGQDAKDLKMFGAKFEDLHRGGWDPEARMADQKRDGVDAEVIYPTVGMLLCNHADYDYKKACFDAYNLWIAEYCAAHPDRLIGLGQTAMRSVEEGIEDVRKMKEMGLRGVMLPGNPQVVRLRRSDLRSVLAGDGRYGYADQLPYPDQQVGWLQDARTAHQRLPVDHPWQPGFDRHVHLRRRVPAQSEPEAGMRRGGRRLGAAFHVSRGPRLQAPSLMDAEARAREDAE